MITMDSLHVKGLIDVRGEGEQGAGNLTLSRVEYDREKGATSHTMSTGDTMVMEQTPLLTNVRTWEHVWKHNIDGGSDFNQWAIGMNTASKLRYRVYKKRKTPCERAHRIQWSIVESFPRNDSTLQEQIPLLEAFTNTFTHSAVRLNSEKKVYLDSHDPVKRKTHSIVLHRAGQHMKRK